ncbi:glycosyltransferase family 4 protein [Fonticella tunisiensis]|uniref:Glycosyltransferase involved in cell wall biosynthesis n=1 Tax=Fonticella tunisiensis TaxID=1096341 RepID=A0A4V3ES01_9CLOT|nr:glycosyltransferase family 4 protein [Fonticella tunisiensis]TDT50817.1 glycosyltransferase involved in cell wall biosynthesis [Fonticella tunisiensis]
MKVLHIISGGETGGSKNHLLSFVEAMRKKGEESIILCFMEGLLYDEAKKAGLDIRLVKQSKRFDLSIIKRIKGICEKEGIDIINCHGGRANFIGYFLKKVYRAIYVTTIHSDYREDYRGNFYKTLIYSNINRAVLNSFDYYITVSSSFKDMLIKRGFKNKNIYVVYNGINFNEVEQNFSREDIIKKYGLRDSKYHVAMVARFHPVKGHRVFLDGCRTVLDKRNDVSFILVGDGNIRNEMEDYAKNLGIRDHISFVGFQRPDEFLFISDFTVLTSFTESFPLVILESAKYRKTVISTEVGGIPDLIEDGVNGYLIKPGDSGTLADRILRLIDDQALCREMGERLHTKARDCYSIENLADKYIQIYRSLLAKEEKND